MLKILVFFSQLADCSAQVFVHWKQISSDDRFPILVKGLEADGSWKGGDIIRWKHGNTLSWEIPDLNGGLIWFNSLGRSSKLYKLFWI